MHVLKICTGNSCQQRFSDSLLKIAKEAQASGTAIEVESCGCLSNCEIGPNVYWGKTGSPLSDIMQEGHVENGMTPNKHRERLELINNQSE